ncbi:MAG: two component, sigma54 specific, transcriptional regulator, Fis family [Acidobacteria bacterium]|nr:two component, sigma54 specific, transcriptional regulator, Fis family [Acidobacteriota bacterium]
MNSRSTKILVVDDEAAMREVLKMRLQEWGFEVCLAEDGLEGKELAESDDPDIVISDVIMPQVSGMDLLRLLKAGDPDRPIILVTAQASIDLAVDAIKQGAQDFVTKPIDYAKLKMILEAAQQEIDLRRESRRLSSQLERGAGFGDFVGTSKLMREVYDLISSIAHSDASVIITGESGTGKELAARTIHELSARSKGPFIAINAAAIPENLMESEMFGHERGAFTGATGVQSGRFELANRGTLFLDEIAEMPLALQPKLLRVLEDRRVRRVGGSQEFQVDVRVLAATNKEPRNAVESGKLREDWFYRLNVFTVALPPLRVRKSDIPLLAQAFIQEFNAKHNQHVESCRIEALELLKAYSWPGNVRELRNIMERAVILAKGPWIEPSHLPAYLLNSPTSESGSKIVLPMGVTAAEAEKELILRTLRLTGNNKAEAARQLGLDVKTIRNKLKAYGIN